MTIALGLHQWLSGFWANLTSGTVIGTNLLDADGVAIAVGNTVKLVGTVVSVDPTARHFDAIGIQMLHPNGTSSIQGETFFVDPSQVLVGS